MLAKAGEFGEEIDSKDPSVKAVVDKMKELEHRGYAFEGAEASFQLMSKKVKGEYEPYFVLHGYNINITKRDEDRVPLVEAAIKVEVGGELEHTAANGDGPRKCA